GEGWSRRGKKTPAGPDGRGGSAPRAARRVDLDLVALFRAHQRAADGRVGRDAADARDLDREAPAALVLELDPRADGDAAVGGGFVVDDDRPCEAGAH